MRIELARQFEQAEEGGSPYVIDRWRDTAANMRTHFERIVFRAGLPIWERLFQNLRESRANDVRKKHGLYKESIWLGHSQRIAVNHYFQVLDEEYKEALKDDCGIETPEKTALAVDAGNMSRGYGNKIECRSYCR